MGPQDSLTPTPSPTPGTSYITASNIGGGNIAGGNVGNIAGGGHVAGNIAGGNIGGGIIAGGNFGNMAGGNGVSSSCSHICSSTHLFRYVATVAALAMTATVSPADAEELRGGGGEIIGWNVSDLICCMFGSELNGSKEARR